MALRYSCENRHAELVSASILQNGPKSRVAKWTLKQVQGDGFGDSK
jgi:hypothetical protein